MRAAWLAVLFYTIAAGCAAAASLAPGSWEYTDLLRNFSISADGKREIDVGGSGPNIERACVNKQQWRFYPGLKNPAVAKRCKVTTISETSNLIDSIVECSADGEAPAYIEHTVVTALTSKSFITVQDTTFMEPNADGSISRSTLYRRGRWLKNSCDK